MSSLQCTRKQVPHCRAVPLPAARRSYAASVQGLGDRAVRGRACRFNLADDGKHVGGKRVRVGALGDSTLGSSLCEVVRIAQLHALVFADR